MVLPRNAYVLEQVLAGKEQQLGELGPCARAKKQGAFNRAMQPVRPIMPTPPVQFRV